MLDRANTPNLLNIQDTTSTGVDRITSQFRLYLHNYNTDYLWILVFNAYGFISSHFALFIAPGFIMLRGLRLNRFTLYSLLLVLQARPVQAANTLLANRLIIGIGWLAYINFMAWYDIFYINIISRHVNQTLIFNGRISFRFLLERSFFL